MTTSRRILINTTAAFAQRMVRGLDQIILVPFYLLAWGADFYGEWLTLMAAPTILSFSDFGFGTAAANSYVIKRVAGENKEAINIAYNGYISITASIFSAIILTGAVMIGINQSHVVANKIIPEALAIKIIFIAVASRIICFYHPLIDAYYISERKNYICINFQTILSLINLLAAILILKTTKNVLELVEAQMIINFILTLVYFLSIAVTKNNTYLNQAVFDKKIVKAIAKKGTAYLLSPVWQVLFFQGTTLAVNYALGPVAVAAFNTARAASRSVNQIYAMVVVGFLSEIQVAIGKSDLVKVRKLHAASVGVIFLVATLGAIFISIMGGDIYITWTQKKINLPTTLLPILAIGVLLNSLWWPTSFLFQATNKPEFLAKSGLLAAVISVMLTYYLSSIFGLIGAGIGAISLEILLAFLIMPAGCKIIKQNINLLPLEAFRELKKISKIHV